MREQHGLKHQTQTAGRGGAGTGTQEAGPSVAHVLQPPPGQHTGPQHRLAPGHCHHLSDRALEARGVSIVL